MRTPNIARLGVVAIVAASLMLLVLVVFGWALEVLAVAVLVPAALAIADRPQRGVLLIALLVPFDGLLDIANLPQVVDAWKEVLVVAVLVATFVCPVAARAPHGRTRPAWLPALIGFIAVGVASAAWYGDLQAVIGLKVNFFYVLLGLAVWRCPLATRERDRLVSILMGTGLVCAIYGLVQQVLGDARLNELGYDYNTTIRKAGTILRSFSTFANPFPYAFFLMLVLLVGIAVSLDQPGRFRNRAFLLATPIYVLGMLSSVVRASVLGLAVGLAYLGFRRYRVLLAGLPIALVAVLVLGVLGGAITSTFSSKSSFQERQVGWEENFVQIGQHPLGVGIGTTGAAAEKAAELTSGNAAYNPDNYYFKTVYEIGILGLWMFLLFLVGAFVVTQRAARLVRPRDGPFLDGIAANVLAAAAVSLVANYFDSFPLDVYFWILLPLAASMGASARNPPGDLTGPDGAEGVSVDA